MHQLLNHSLSFPSLILASERDRNRLLQSLLDIVLQLQRADYACLAIADPKSADLALDLVAAGTFGAIETFEDLKLNNAGVHCPASILLHTANTKKTKRLGDPGVVALFKRDPFFTARFPKTAACYPIRVQGKFVGVFFVSSNSALAAAAEHQVTVLATFAAIALENQYARSTLESIIASRTLQLTQALNHRSSFLTSVSHELRTPLFSIIGLLTVLENSSDLSAPHLETLSTIRASSQQLHRLIDNVLDLAKLEAGSIKPEVIPFNLREVVESAVETLAYVANSKGLELVVATDVSADPPPLLGDPHRLRQAMLNLIANAVKFTSKGTVDVTWKAEPEGSRLRVEIAVRDTGVGVSEVVRAGRGNH
jgi:signal transduction histidine kinase